VAVFEKIMIANRGEIALRIMRTAQAMGYRTVAVYSEVDRAMPHVALADEAVPIGPSPAAESYLAADKIIEAAKRTGADAIHPGYGFLSENAEFAEACGAGKIIFIGPSAVAIRLMGNKATARRLMIDAGVPCVPGYHGMDQSDDALAREAASIGFPVMIKAAAGGGGRGMRLVAKARRFPEALRSARSEASKAFGSDELILEKAIASARHVEVQVFGGGRGSIVHLGERDCSIQRRHQKLIEEAPCPALSTELREGLCRAAITVCGAIDYSNAGTIEFLLAPDKKFYFLEMNTRLQVEHAVTEMNTGLDLVEWQLRVAAGEPLPLRQEQIRFHGHTIEARLCAEDPEHDFLPASGKLIAWNRPNGTGVRVDHGIAPGVSISSYYDSMLAKIVAHGTTREEARRRLVAALKETVVFGISTNRDFLIECLSHLAFIGADIDTGFIEKNLLDRKAQKPGAHLVSLAAVLISKRTQNGIDPLLLNWHSSGVLATFVLIGCGEQRIAAEIFSHSGRAYTVKWANESHDTEIQVEDGMHLRFLFAGVEQTAQFAWNGGVLYLSVDGHTSRFEDIQVTASAATVSGGDAAIAPMAGRISAVHVKAGEEVGKGQCLLVLEAMKMEHEVAAPRNGTIAAVLVQQGEQVTTRTRLVELVPLAAE
jgi:geranyl-CoA carboxylase alpha subunit